MYYQKLLFLIISLNVFKIHSQKVRMSVRLAEIEETLIRQKKAQQETLNLSSTLLQQNKDIVPHIQQNLKKTEAVIVGNVTNATRSLVKEALNKSSPFITDIKRMLENTSKIHHAEMNDTKVKLLAEVAHIQTELRKQRIHFSNIEQHFKNNEITLDEVLERVEEIAEELSNRDMSWFTHKVLNLQGQISDLQRSLKILRPVARDCMEIRNRGNHVSGVFNIQPAIAEEPFRVFCDMKTEKGGWVYLMTRFDGSEDFNRNWTDYKKGFGSLRGEFWLGLEQIHQLTNDPENPTELLVEVVDWNNNKGRAFYTNFSVGSERESYALQAVDGYSGNAGDVLDYHEDAPFSTPDRDNSDPKDCAKSFHSGWWHRKCFVAHLTGPYLKKDSAKTTRKGIHWGPFGGNYTSLKQARMMIRPRGSADGLLPHERAL